MVRKALWISIGVAALLALVVLAVFAGLFEKSVVMRDIDQPLTADQMKTLAKRGAYVAVAADCYACHTARDGAPWAGGDSAGGRRNADGEGPTKRATEEAQFARGAFG